MINLCFSESTKGSLKYTFRERGEQTVCLPLALYCGDISDVFNIESRQKEYRQLAPDYAACVEQHIREFKILIKKERDIRIWYSSGEPSEYCGCLQAASFLQNYNLSTVDCFREVIRGNSTIRYTHTGEMTEEDLLEFLRYEESVGPERQKEISRIFAILKGENAPLRVIENDRLVSVPADYYDEIIRRHFKMEKTSIARIIGDVISCENIYHDTWIAERIRSFIDSGVLMAVTENEEFYRWRVKLR